MSVTHGPWSGPPIKQPAPRPGYWFHRDEHGALWVWLPDRPGWKPTPVELAAIDEPLPDRPANRDRITCALDLRSMEGPEVDEALGVADAFDTVVDSWEDGTGLPSHDDIRRLATLTGMLPSWFYAGTLGRMDGFFYCGRSSTRVGR